MKMLLFCGFGRMSWRDIFLVVEFFLLMWRSRRYDLEWGLSSIRAFTASNLSILRERGDI